MSDAFFAKVKLKSNLISDALLHGREDRRSQGSIVNHPTTTERNPLRSNFPDRTTEERRKQPTAAAAVTAPALYLFPADASLLMLLLTSLTNTNRLETPSKLFRLQQQLSGASLSRA